ncbi:TonB-dependent receptor plug domain-containing protein [Vitreimonas flagellata]|uniref:TonB-dependent receptor plug domain-containing protein n=1 Tax=Vitreimonas flagellata TaxID=2560861 RepID=UPI001431FD02|nr:TonB-dependent receptor [Vitreimonas flagellata]
MHKGKFHAHASLRCALAASTAIFASSAAFAQEQSAAADAVGAVVYDAAFFAQFSPRTALDMIERVPGFVLDEGAERRGFAGAQSNVLINGEPPTSKAQEIDDILARIPARDVERIELIRGGGASAGSAQSMHVNVVRRGGEGEGEGIWSLSAERAEEGRVSPSVGAAWSGRRGALEYGLSLDLDVAHAPVRGLRVDRDESGELDERRVERIPLDGREGVLAGEASFPLFGWHTALNAQISRSESDEREATQMFDAFSVSDGAVEGDLAEREDIAELSVALRREFGPWRAEFGGVATRRWYEGDEATVERDAGGVLEEAAWQSQSLESGETIARAALRRDLPRDWSVELSAEGALNTLEQRLALVEDDGAGPAPVVLPSANVRVEEVRAEFGAMLAGQLSPRWSLEAGASVEFSNLTQSGDSDRETVLEYWKPSLQLTRSLGERDQVRFRLFRDVGQLDFEDFVSAADITSSVVIAGNPGLRPETSWRAEAAGDWRFGEDGALSVTLYHWAIEDALDVVPVGPPGDQLDAPGNIGDAEMNGFRVSTSIPLTWGASLRIDFMEQRSQATDPLTGVKRELSEIDESALTMGLRQDFSIFAWGLDYERETETPSYQLDQIELERDAEDLTLWIETTAFAGLKLRAWGSNLTDDAETRDRRHYDADRLGLFDGLDYRARGEGPMFGLSASGQF